MAIDVYWWLTKRVYNLRERVTITWQQLYRQFGSDSELKEFKRKFKLAVAEVVEVYPCRITLEPQRVTVFPNQTSVPTVTQTRAVERKRAAAPSPAPARAGESERKPRESIEAHWIEIAGWGEVWMTSELFDVGPGPCPSGGVRRFRFVSGVRVVNAIAPCMGTSRNHCSDTQKSKLTKK